MKSYKFGYPFIFLFFCLIMLVSTLNPIANITRDEDRIHTVPRTNGIELSLLKIYSISDLDEFPTQGNNNYLLDAGEIVDVMLQLQNLGDTDANSVVAEIACADEFVVIPVNTTSYGTILPSISKVGSTPFRIQVNSSCPANYVLNITLNLTADAYSVTRFFQLQVMGTPELTFVTFFVDSEQNGGLPSDDDGIVDAGEEVTIYLYVQNSGGATVFGLEGLLSTTDEGTQIDDTSGFFGDIEGFEDWDYGLFGFVVNTSKLIPDKQAIPFTLSLTDDWNMKWNLSFEITVNGTASFELFDYAFESEVGDDDTEMDAGERCGIILDLRNNGTARAIDYSIFVDSSDPYIEFNYEPSYRTMFCDDYYDTLLPNSSIVRSTYYWDFELSPVTPLHHIASIQFYINDTTTSKMQIFTIFVQNQGISDYTLSNIELAQYTGDDDIDIDAGESWFFSLILTNIGGANGEQIYVSIDTEDEFVSFFYYADYGYSNISTGALASGSNISLSEPTYWRIVVSDQALRNHTVTFIITITDASQHIWQQNYIFIIVEGRVFQVNWLRLIGWSIFGCVALGITLRYGYTHQDVIGKKIQQIREKSLRLKLIQYTGKLKSLRYPFHWNLQSEQPEAMLKNINNMHHFSLDLIRRKKYTKADAVITEEIRQYKHTMTLLKEMNLADLNSKIRVKLKMIKKLQFQVRDTAFSTSYQDLMDQLPSYQENEKYNKVHQKVLKMKLLLQNHQHYLKKHRKTEELVKLEAIEQNLHEIEHFNSMVLHVKNFEGNHNRISDFLEKQQYKQAHQLTAKTLQTISTFLSGEFGLERERDLAIFTEVDFIQNALTEVDAQITARYAKMIEGSSLTELVLPRKTILVQAPEFQSLPITGLNEFLQELDAQFVEWSRDGQSKAGKKAK